MRGRWLEKKEEKVNRAGSGRTAKANDSPCVTGGPISRPFLCCYF